MDVDQMWDYLEQNGIATEAELRLVTDVAGYSEDIMSDILYSRTGYSDFDSYTEDMGE